MPKTKEQLKQTYYTPKQQELLDVLADGKAYHRKELANRLHVNNTYVTTLCTQLHKQGLLERTRRGRWVYYSLGEE